MTKNILVTGGAGFIGSHLVDALVARGNDVVVLDSLEPQVHSRKPEYLNPKAEYTFADIRADGVLGRILPDVDVVVHLASVVGVGQSMYEIARYVDANVNGTAKLLQALVDADHRVKKLVLASSMSLYGEGAYECEACGRVAPSIRGEAQLAKKEWELRCPNCHAIVRPVPTDESKPLAATSVYAITKRDQEELCLAMGRAYGIPTVALRFFNAYGPRQSLDNPYTGVCAIFQSRIKNGQPPVVFEDGGQTRDFVSVRDIVGACQLSMERSAADGETLNVGSGRPVSILEVAQTLLDLFRSTQAPTVAHSYRAGDVRHCFADISKAKRLLGYSPEILFKRGMKELVEWGKAAESTDQFDRAFGELKTHGLVAE